MSSWPSESEVFAIFEDVDIGVSLFCFWHQYTILLITMLSIFLKIIVFFSCFLLLDCVRVLFIFFYSSQVSSAYLMSGGSLFPLKKEQNKNKTTFTQGAKDHPLIK